ncbi:unnamed protein product [Nippostrongylus brasiliensis]|uniref:Phospholipid scramblase n=1 Tax=Nippostrongylus brasiliensis TaxID=27835 RepID=A0A0N4YEU1_NIPBR|nr:unnamed protein product [Nippostrongylus brasiliensis]
MVEKADYAKERVFSAKARAVGTTGTGRLDRNLSSSSSEHSCCLYQAPPLQRHTYDEPVGHVAFEHPPQPDVLPVYQHGTIGNFLRQELEGGFSSFIRCVYQAKRVNNNTVTLVCERDQGCCEHGCCPKDQHWMAGVYVLLAFVLLVFVVGTVLMIVCYQRSKNKQRKEMRQATEYNGYASSQLTLPMADQPTKTNALFLTVFADGISNDDGDGLIVANRDLASEGDAFVFPVLGLMIGLTLDEVNKRMSFLGIPDSVLQFLFSLFLR